MNNAVNMSTRVTPFMLNYGQNPDTPLVAQIRRYNPEVNQFVGRWSLQLKHAKQCLAAAQDRQKALADKHRRPAEKLKPGDKVLVHIKHFNLQQGLKRKLAPRYLGPFIVLEEIGPQGLSYKVKLPPTLRRMHPVFHVSSLKKYYGTGTYQPPPLTVVQGTADTCESVTDYKRVNRKIQYRVHWMGGGKTWEPVQVLHSAIDHIKAFWASKGDSPPPDGLPPSLEELEHLLAHGLDRVPSLELEDKSHLGGQ
jgi:hypothetical protein